MVKCLSVSYVSARVHRKQEKLNFNKIECQERLPFVIYADFESILVRNETVERDSLRSWTGRYRFRATRSKGNPKVFDEQNPDGDFVTTALERIQHSYSLSYLSKRF